MLKKRIDSSIMLGLVAIALIAGMVPEASGNGLIFKNPASASPSVIAPNVVTPPTVLFPDGLSLGNGSSVTQPTIRRVSWGRVNAGGTVGNSGSGDWTNVFENGMGIFNLISFIPPFTSEPVCTITPHGQIPVGISYTYYPSPGCGTGDTSCISVWQSASEAIPYFDQAFNFICIQ